MNTETKIPGPLGYQKAGNDADQWLIYDQDGRTVGLSYHGEPLAQLFSSAPSMALELEKLKADKASLIAALEKALADMVPYIPKASQGYAEGCFKYVAGGWDMWGCECPVCAIRIAITKARLK